MSTLKTIAGSVVVTAVTTLGLGWFYIERTAPAQPAPVSSTVEEDSPSWDCRTDGNRSCGPITLTPGCFNERAELVAPWPCHVVVNPDGSSDVYEGVAR